MYIIKFVFINLFLKSYSFTSNKIIENKNIIKQSRIILNSFNNSYLHNHHETEYEPDLIDKYSDWFGWFPREEKWKSIRFTFYSIFAGYMVAESVQSFQEIFNPTLTDYFDN